MSTTAQQLDITEFFAGVGYFPDVAAISAAEPVLAFGSGSGTTSSARSSSPKASPATASLRAACIGGAMQRDNCRRAD
jgi:hypothetical protein